MVEEKPYEIEDGKCIPMRGKGYVGTIYDEARREFEPIYKALVREGKLVRGEKKKFADRVLDKHPDIKKMRTVYDWMKLWDAELAKAKIEEGCASTST
ncbi:hypothetical protein [Dyella acidisoli]|uniref:Uncharacterized protein n=1 Tax=Dyella acidisoli TaxID=1867834 RepID=A0ABQ5XTS6_9GAMM|nr:hypothetical protein [Dyella acidisoli]GLQ95144.1 hypothetical protein GCM10007901_40990 [Dyella acidisoli]